MLFRAKTKYIFESSLQFSGCTFLVNYLQLKRSWLAGWCYCLRSRLFFFHVFLFKYVSSDIFGLRIFAIALNLAPAPNYCQDFPSLLTLPLQSTMIKLSQWSEHCSLTSFTYLGSSPLEASTQRWAWPIWGFIPPLWWAIVCEGVFSTSLEAASVSLIPPASPLSLAWPSQSL